MLGIAHKRWLAEYAEGSCLTVHQLLHTLRINYNLLNADEDLVMDAINEQGVYLCDTCGWWNEENDIYSANECDDCHVCEHKNIVFSFEGDYCPDCDETFFDNTGK